MAKIRWKSASFWITVLSVALACLSVTLTYVRLRYGVDITDETYYIADARLIAKGAVPFVTNWSLSGSSVFAWLVALFERLTGSTEGIMLFMRYAFFGCKLIGCACIFLLLYRHMSPAVLLGMLAAYMPVVPNNIFSFGYNPMSSLLVFLCLALLLKSVLVKRKGQSACFAALGGASMAVDCYVYQVNVLLAAMVFILFFVCWRVARKGEGLWPPFAYAGAGLLVGVLTVCWIAIAGGGLSGILNGIDNILHSPYFSINKVTLDTRFKQLLEGLKNFSYILLSTGALGFLFFLPTLFIRRAASGLHQRMAMFRFCCLVCLLPVLIVFFSYLSSEQDWRHMLLNSSLFPLPLFLFFSDGRKTRAPYAPFLWLLWLPNVLNLLMNMRIVSGSVRWYLLTTGVLSMLQFYHVALWHAAEAVGTSIPFARRHGRAIAGCFSFVLACMLVLTNVQGLYEYMYRDAHYTECTDKIESGVYKGLYTVPARAKALVYLEEEIRKVTDESDTVLFLDLAPAGYLMSGARFSAPSAWDFMQYTYGFTDDASMHAFFSVTREPTKIIYVETDGRDDVMSIETSDYKFNSFVNTNYTQTYANDADMFRILVYERSNPQSVP